MVLTRENKLPQKLFGGAYVKYNTHGQPSSTSVASLLHTAIPDPISSTGQKLPLITWLFEHCNMKCIHTEPSKCIFARLIN